MTKDIGGWDEYLNNFLKASDVTSDTQIFIVISIEEVENRDQKSIRITMESMGNEYLMDLNKTNLAFLKNSGIKTPRNIIGKKLYFKKVIVRNPKTNLEVEGLRISKVD